MFRLNIKIAIRNLFKNKAYAAINLFGLALGLTCAILIILYINAEFSVDKFLTDKENIYRINVCAITPTQAYTTAQTPYPLGPALASEVPGFENNTRVFLGNHNLVGYRDKKYFEDHAIFVDSSFFDIFSYKLIAGNKNSVLNKPNSVILAKSIVPKYFEGENPVGKIINFGNNKKLEVTGIVEDPPVNSSLKFDFIINMKMLDASIVGFSPDQWGAYTRLFTFVKLNKNVNPVKLQSKIKNFIDNKTPDDTKYSHKIELQKITDINLDPTVVSGHSEVTDPSKLYILGSIGLFIILLACINFMNLATARASKRAKEVGVRKVLGAYRKQLAQQFLGESIIISFTSLFLSIIFSEVLLRHFSELVNTKFSSSLSGNPEIIFAVVTLTFVVGIAAGIYPAIFLSRFKPVTVLKGDFTEGKYKRAGGGLRKVLVVLQFSISIIFIIGMLIIKEQLSFLQNKDLGFKYNNRIVLTAYEDTARTGYEAIKAQLLTIPGVRDVAVGLKPPVSNNTFGTNAYLKGTDSKNSFPISLYFTEATYFEDFDMKFAAGRPFPNRYIEGDNKPIVVNETLLKNIGIKNPADAIGKEIVTGINDWSMKIVGVIKDYNHMSLHAKIQPLVFMCWPRFFYRYTIAITPSGSAQTIARIKNIWKKYMSGYPFEYKYLSDEIAEMYKSDERTDTIITDFSVVAVLIACLGIFGLVLFTAEQKTKEIGIRKVLGASVKNILHLISFDFIKLVLLSNIIAWPVGYYFMNKWLQEFAYHINITILPFILAAIITLFIAILTVSYQSIKSAVSNPVNSLRYE